MVHGRIRDREGLDHDQRSIEQVLRVSAPGRHTLNSSSSVLLLFVALGIKSRALHMLSEHSTTEVYAQVHILNF
jgi:hypothetical protein